MFKRLNEVQGELQELRDKGFQRGYNVGWDWDLFPYTVKLGSTTYMGAAPATGKSEFMKEIQINLSCLHGLNHVIFSPETGNTQEIYSELCHSFVGKQYVKGHVQMTEAERVHAEQFINNHFVIVDPIDEDLTLENFYSLVDDIEIHTGKTIHTTLVDPWNELTEQFEPDDLGREDKYLSRMLGYARKNARAKNRHHFLVTHVRDQAMVTVKEVRYFPMAHAREFAGGQVWFRKGNTVLIPWRPPYGLSDDNNRPYEMNELHVKVAKSKPKGVSKNGTYRMYLDTDRYQYYFMWEGKRVYANRGQYSKDTPQNREPKPLEVNRYFDNEADELPF